MELDELEHMLARIRDCLRRAEKLQLTQQEYELADALLRNNIDVGRLHWQLTRVRTVVKRGVM